ncbi:MAG TPA: flagellar hook-basal body complex protein FliE [Rubrivivax sp.]|jgi:flagellar hook-basal body complex protein FliE|nr:flagellar hook-basal body complex protein FliE [Rhodoferax sp.]MCL4737326.1 flagellar hook-basal body complex protein FliE [Burkholderiaceae bacterium]MCP5288888.1 flagellar hook-basal body complex protein FliE [Burkholderiaceae bacterium]HMQ71390.1 flagellar hook-basal body complex protein FliE [Rubrivivax sp.]HMR69212.1 flagellar hook-basal body complex protein FliE [Rubrivivax sp.]
MKLELKPFDFQQAVARAGLRLDGVSGAPGTSPARGTASAGASFRDAMVKALGGVSDAQVEASRLQREFSLENPAVSLESVMIASEKAKLGFTAAVSVRNRLVQAYTEIMNMQV